MARLSLSLSFSLCLSLTHSLSLSLPASPAFSPPEVHLPRLRELSFGVVCSLSLSDSLPHPIMLSHPLSRSLPEVYLLREDRLRRGCVNCLSISLSLFLSLSFPPSRPPFLSLTHSLPHPRERLVSYCRTTSASTAPRTPRRTCCPYAYVLITVLRVSDRGLWYAPPASERRGNYLKSFKGFYLKVKVNLALTVLSGLDCLIWP